tara:strand:+ start:48 stop:608 length:561 start_codon:yes stop_codon:yes gene_type:complete
LKQKLLHLYIANILLFSLGLPLYGKDDTKKLLIASKWIKRTILKNLNFLPYIEYKPTIKPSKSGNILLTELKVFENIIDDHIKFEYDVNQKLILEKGNRIDEIYNIITRKRKLWRTRRRKDPIEDIISDINYIRGLTSRYERWGPKWDDQTDILKSDLNLDEIDLVQFEIRRLSKKHRHMITKQKI